MADLEVVTLQETVSRPSLFRSRMRGDTVHFGAKDEVAVSVEALTALQFKHVNAEAEAEGEGALLYWLLRFGIKNVTGLTDQDGRAVPYTTQKCSIAGRYFDVCSDELIDGLHGWMVDALGKQIVALTALEYEDAESLGFTSPSDENAPSVVPAASAPVCNAAASDGTDKPVA
jgi:hypothetical protein